MSPRPDVSKERTQQILDAAIEAFSPTGFHKASMDDIVEEAKLSKGALYWYFKSKDEIIAGILDLILVRELAGIRQLAQAEGSAGERVMEFARLTITEIKDMLRLIPITYEFYALALRNKAVQKVARQYFQSYVDAIVPIIDQGIARGEFRSTDGHLVAVTLMATVEGTLLLWVVNPKMMNLEEQLKFGIRSLLDGLTVSGKLSK